MDGKAVIDYDRLRSEAEAAIDNAETGLPDEVFSFVSSLTPMVNVDLLVVRDGKVLLAWRDDGRNLGLKINMCDRHDKEDTPYVSISYNGSPIYEQRDYVLRFGSNEENGLSNVAILGMDDYLWIYTDPTTEYDYPASEYSEERLNRTLGLKIELNSYDGEEAPILKIIYDTSNINIRNII